MKNLTLEKCRICDIQGQLFILSAHSEQNPEIAETEQ